MDLLRRILLFVGRALAEAMVMLLVLAAFLYLPVHLTFDKLKDITWDTASATATLVAAIAALVIGLAPERRRIREQADRAVHRAMVLGYELERFSLEYFLFVKRVRKLNGMLMNTSRAMERHLVSDSILFEQTVSHLELFDGEVAKKLAVAFVSWSRIRSVAKAAQIPITAKRGEQALLEWAKEVEGAAKDLLDARDALFSVAGVTRRDDIEGAAEAALGISRE
jgi:hypothetical protein